MPYGLFVPEVFVGAPHHRAIRRSLMPPRLARVAALFNPKTHTGQYCDVLEAGLIIPPGLLAIADEVIE
jgi:hypothetical protein